MPLPEWPELGGWRRPNRADSTKPTLRQDAPVPAPVETPPASNIAPSTAWNAAIRGEGTAPVRARSVEPTPLRDIAATVEAEHADIWSLPRSCSGNDPITVHDDGEPTPLRDIAIVKAEYVDIWALAQRCSGNSPIIVHDSVEPTPLRDTAATVEAEYVGTALWSLARRCSGTDPIIRRDVVEIEPAPDEARPEPLPAPPGVRYVNTNPTAAQVRRDWKR